MKKTMQDSKRWELWERLAPVVLEREEGFGNITVGGATDQQGKDNLLDFIASEISKAMEEGYEEAKKDMAVGVGLATDTELPEIVSKIASKLTTK